MNLVLIPTYKDIFKPGTEKTLKEYFKVIASENLLNLTSFISATISNRETNFEQQNGLLLQLLSLSPNHIRELIISSINEVVGNHQSVIFHYISNLLITQYSLINFNGKVSPKPVEKDFINILQAYLTINEEINNKLLKLIDSTENLSNEEKYICLTISQNENNRNPIYFTSQSIKSKYFLEFVQITEPYKKFFKNFISEMSLKNWESYLEILWIVYLKIFNPNQKSNTNNTRNILRVDDNNPGVKKFLDNFSYSKNKIVAKYNENDLDFKIVRDYPLYKLNKDHYLILSLNFFMDKIFHALQFNYYSVMNRNGYNKGFESYRSNFGTEFTEKYLFYKTIDNIFENINCIKVNGAKYNLNKSKDYSDYYIRKGNIIILFECKDRIMKAEIKNSLDKDKVLKDINEKFIQVGSNQLINTIQSLSSGGFSFDKLDKTLLNNKKITVYPIIVYTDNSYSVDCVNYYVNYSFRKKIDMLSLNLKVKDLTLIELDSLLIYLDFFNDQRFDLIKLINDYHGQIKKYRNQIVDAKYDEFRIFLGKYFVKRRYKYKTPEILKKIYEQIIIKG